MQKPIEEVAKNLYTEENAQKLENYIHERNLYGFQAFARNFYGAMHQIDNKIGRIKGEHRKVDYSLKDMCNFAFDFYLDFDEELFDTIVSTLHKDTTQYHCAEPTDKGGRNDVGLHLSGENSKWDKDFLEVNLSPKNSIAGMIQVAHEMAHILSEKFQKMKIAKEDCVGEIESKFIEYAYCDYLLKKGIISQEDFEEERKKHNTTLKDEICTIYQENDFLNILCEVDKPLTLKSLKEFDHIAKTDERFRDNYGPIVRRLDDFMKNKERDGSYFFRYVVGEIVGRTLFTEYKKELEKTGAATETISKFKKFLDTNADINLEQAAKTLLGENYMEKISNEFGIELPKTK